MNLLGWLIDDQIEWLQANDALARQLAENARNFGNKSAFP